MFEWQKKLLVEQSASANSAMDTTSQAIALPTGGTQGGQSTCICQNSSQFKSPARGSNAPLGLEGGKRPFNPPYVGQGGISKLQLPLHLPHPALMDEASSTIGIIPLGVKNRVEIKVRPLTGTVVITMNLNKVQFLSLGLYNLTNETKGIINQPYMYNDNSVIHYTYIAMNRSIMSQLTITFLR